MAKRLLVTGSASLIGAEVCRHFGALEFEIHRLEERGLDIRRREAVVDFVREVKPYGIVHAAENPWREGIVPQPFDDFDFNTGGTLNLLEGARRFAPESPFIQISSRWVYGDRPNTIPLRELSTRWDFADPGYAEGIAEEFPVGQSTHTPFGVSKLAADSLVQEYGRYFHIPSCSLRVGDVAGPGPRLGPGPDGFLQDVIQANFAGRDYVIHGYKGKQVRDIIHAGDVAKFIHAFYEQPRCGAVYNLGGGRANSFSILEAFRLVEKETGRTMRQIYHEKNRIGDTICYYNDLRMAKNHYPHWNLTKNLQQIVTELVEYHRPVSR
ncbi:MAG: NAD-dependent epimerase/dehydratase family protein [Methylacidiphilales bacterium]|nr:NAD-dependent epimerase/dehydratase family protein [Candidatus Methylacidiphilales bacterium]